MRAVLAAVATCVLAVGTVTVTADAETAHAAERVDHVAPVDAPVTDLFRPPANPYGSGNRGWTYQTRPGQPVGASGPGLVAFAGPVAGRLVVSVDHPDGVRTTYTGLTAISVTRGDSIEGQTVIGTASGELHFGVRVGTAYLDPASILAQQPRVHLVGDPDAPGALGRDGQGWDPVRWLGGGLSAGYGWVRDRLTEALVLGGMALEVALGMAAALASPGLLDPLVDLALEVVGDEPHLAFILQLVDEWNPLSVVHRAGFALREARQPCTGPSVAAPQVTEDRIVVVVDGLDSSSDGSLVAQLDPEALGYAEASVVQFSYAGGAVPATAGSSGLWTSEYDEEDTEAGVALSSERLATLLREVAEENPGRPIDIVAHSYGGLVARHAVAAPGVEVQTLVTLAAPIGGADLASTATLVTGNPLGSGLASLADEADDRFAGVLPDARSDAVADMAEWSPAVRDLPPVPDGVDITHVATRGDAMVTNRQSREADARFTVVDGGNHGDLPGSAAAHREVALAVAGMPPTCRSLYSHLDDHLTAEALSFGIDATTAVGGYLVARPAAAAGRTAVGRWIANLGNG